MISMWMIAGGSSSAIPAITASRGLPLDLEFEFSIGGAPPHDFNQLKYFALDELGRLCVGDQDNHRVVVFDRNLALLGQMGTGSAGDSAHQLNGLEGVVARGRDVWIADTYNNRVVRYREKDGSTD
jgi:hypothetical protein